MAYAASRTGARFRGSRLQRHDATRGDFMDVDALVKRWQEHRQGPRPAEVWTRLFGKWEILAR